MISAMACARSANMRAISVMGARRAGARVEQDLADAVAGGGAAGLAKQDGLLAAAREPCRQALDLRGFARAVEAFESDENTARHGMSLSSVDWGLGTVRAHSGGARLRARVSNGCKFHASEPRGSPHLSH